MRDVVSLKITDEDIQGPASQSEASVNNTTARSQGKASPWAVQTTFLPLQENRQSLAD